jgi:Ni,Fe-hydrogenase III small subunit
VTFEDDKERVREAVRTYLIASHLGTAFLTENMREALRNGYESVPAPKIVIAVGACAISGGPYVNHAEAHNGAGDGVPVDLYVPGCPPHPLTILDGILRLLGRLEGGRPSAAGSPSAS